MQYRRKRGEKKRTSREKHFNKKLIFISSRGPYCRLLFVLFFLFFFFPLFCSFSFLLLDGMINDWSNTQNGWVGVTNFSGICEPA